METLEKVKQKFNVNINEKSPIFLKEQNRYEDLTVLFRELGFKVGAEIGVSKGRYSKFLLVKIPKLKLFCIDPYMAYNEYVEANREGGQETLNEHYEKAKGRLSKYDAIFVKKTSMEAVKDFEDESLDFVFIDGNHTFEYAVNDIAEWYKKVRKGGIVSGHDFWNSIEIEDKRLWIENPTPEERIKLCQVKEAVIGWTKANKIEPWFVLTGRRDKTWFWIKK